MSQNVSKTKIGLYEAMKHYRISEKEEAKTILMKSGIHKDIDEQLRRYSNQYGAIQVIIDIDPYYPASIMRVIKADIPTR